MNDTVQAPVILLPIETAVILPEALRPPEADSTEAINVPDEAPSPEPVPPRRGFFRRIRDGILSVSEWVFGAVALVIGLSVLAAAPILQFFCFGYLLEAGGRVARSGRLRDGFVGVRKAARLGSMAVGCGVMLLPLQLVASLARSAELVDPGGPAARHWRLGLTVLTVLMVVHLIAACARGGMLRYFFWPFATPLWVVRRLRQGRVYATARDEVWVTCPRILVQLL